ncbi:uncharacterized protein LOC143013228 [Genypterus blacodes]|uniref:uncharacterized protein LOC143013228 n=1 Tax=Genypterus blacodes TaxID=154954 RepID=UPI003F76AC7C
MKWEALLVLLFSLCRTLAEEENGENDLPQQVTHEQPNLQTTARSIELWREFIVLRNMVLEQTVELRNQKERVDEQRAELNSTQTKLEELRRENAVVVSRMTATETEVKTFRDELSSTKAELQLQKSKVEEMERKNAAQLSTMGDRVSAHEKRLDGLSRDDLALTAQLTAMEVRMSTGEEMLEELRTEKANRPKVAFSVGLTDAGKVGPFNTDTTLTYGKIFSNIGQVYNPITGIFTAPRRGLYYFTYTGFDFQAVTFGLALYHNYKVVLRSAVKKNDQDNMYFSNAILLQLEESDVVYARLPTNYQLYDDGNNRCTLTGFLLFPL